MRSSWTTQLISALSAVAVAAGLAGAAQSGADQHPPNNVQTCVSLGLSQIKCQSPGNVQVNDAPPPVNYFPYSG